MPIALADKNGFDDFFLQEFKTGNASGAMRSYSLLQAFDENQYIRDCRQKIVVRTLDSLVHELRLPYPNVVSDVRPADRAHQQPRLHAVAG